MGTFFVVRNAAPPWGDYGEMLVSGMASRQDDGSIALERAGPFVPPITLIAPDVLVVTDAFRRELEGSGLRGLSFRGAIRKRIVRVDWRHWDRTKSDPERYPPDGEPENYILRRRHNAALAHEIGPLWEVVIDTDGDGESRDVVRTSTGRIFVSEAGREWLAHNAGEWLQFLEP